MFPPMRNLRKVLALVDCGSVMTSAGARQVNKGYVCLMHQADAEPLIRRGMLEDVTTG